MNDLMPAWTGYLNRAYQYDVRPEDITEWDIKKAYPGLKPERIYAPLLSNDFWWDVKPMKKSRKYLRKLTQEGYEIYVITASNFLTINTKVLWIRKYFPFIREKNVILTHKKQRINVDVMIDDYPDNLNGGKYHCILFEQPYNIGQRESGWYTAKNWEAVYEYVHEITRVINVFQSIR